MKLHGQSFAWWNDQWNKIRTNACSDLKFANLKMRTFRVNIWLTSSLNLPRSRINVIFETSPGAIQMWYTDTILTARLYQKPHRGLNTTEPKFRRSSSGNRDKTRSFTHIESFSTVNWIAISLIFQILIISSYSPKIRIRHTNKITVCY